ncbi:MAG: JAB domain-containing protein [Limisphaerales bacterium]
MRVVAFFFVRCIPPSCFSERIQPRSDPASAGWMAQKEFVEQSLDQQQIPKKRKQQPKEYKVITLRECATPDEKQICEEPKSAVEYWHAHIATSPHFNPDCECFVVLLLNTRRRIKGHQLISIGILDQILVHPREVFRAAIAIAAGAVVLMHNHPSDDPTPSEADIKTTRDLIRAGQLLKIDVVDHVIVSSSKHTSLRELGYFYS